MNTALTLVIILLVLLLMLMAVGLLMYYITQQDLKNVSARLSALDAPKPAPARSPDMVRRERTAAYDKLVMLEASFSSEPREELTPEDIATFEEARRAFKACNAELQRMQEWMGLPYDLDWPDVMQRLPRVMALYRKAVEEATEQAQGAA